MRKRKLITHLFASYIVLAFMAISLFTLLASQGIERFYRDQKIRDLKVRTLLVKDLLKHNDLDSLDKLSAELHSLGSGMDTRITLISAKGKVLIDTQEDPSTMDRHDDRPEIRQALDQGWGLSQRYSYTLEEDYLYYAVKLENQTNHYFIRLALSMADLTQTLSKIKKDFVYLGALVFLFLAIINWYISRTITRQVQVVEAAAKRFARGKLKMRVPESSIHELDSLTHSLNQMTEQIFERIRMLTQQKNEQIAILSSMTEGVIALSPESTVLSINKAAAQMFGVKLKKVLQKPLYESIRNAELNKFLAEVLESDKSRQVRIQVHVPEERTLSVIGSRMPAKKGSMAGAVLVLTDLTQVQRLEGVRRDFVANVSHELKTPITSIQGYVETLQGGAYADGENAERFLEIIAKHANRLGQIIDDLLELSKIEDISDAELKDMQDVLARDLLESVVQNYHVLIKQKNINIVFEMESDISVKANRKLLTLALGNLLDNALKYSESGSQVILRAFRSDEKIIFEVSDQGRGIQEDELDRIFERFYRVDKSRSRDIGGTGLGLSLVKHIARVHKAKIEVESALGQGSTFRLKIPV